ncbi:hypothetical protein N7468_000034 [Penicillium chermesinum]|uniref:Major facilitator superfamily (MFS) profile domain-containing protein n=1 Tax=Penicillium chermesinum TaxID=63820 RepID=A0A9W9TXZ5_9EURO|nr:uncharacterized protein N7468_000034 [Penicillium chermesinum]KAJ5248583.1 hypothetical protein N7468_000034 [Penicillium chermesinum]
MTADLDEKGLKGQGVTTSTDLAPHDSEANENLHYVRRGEDHVDPLASQGSINGYDPELMNGRTLLTVEEEKKLLRKIDWRLMTLCSLIFMFKNLDGNNTSNARIMNKGTDQNIMTQLGLSSNDYSLVTVVYYIPYIVLEAPSNLLLKRFSPSKWQSRIMIGWGVFLMCNAAVKNKGGFYATRFLLGAVRITTFEQFGSFLTFPQAEAGQFPGVILQMTYWYRPDELSIRLLYFYICGNFSGIFSSLLAYGFDTVSGAGGLSGWQWLFLVEGIATVIFGVVIWFLLPDFPETAKWLTDREKKELNFNFREIIDSIRDIRLWLFTAIWATFTVGTEGVKFYQATVISNLGFTTIAAAQILNIPITVAGLLLIGGTGIMADRTNIPRPLYPLTFLVGIMACYGVFVAYPSDGAIYAVTLIANAIHDSWFPIMWPWRVQTTARATGSAFSIGFVNSYGQIGGAIGPQIFRSEYAPHYTLPFSVAIGLIGLCTILTLITWWITRETESETRRLKMAKLAAAKRGETILEDVVDRDLKHARNS